jgi:hypothetical protein
MYTLTAGVTWPRACIHNMITIKCKSYSSAFVDSITDGRIHHQSTCNEVAAEWYTPMHYSTPDINTKCTSTITIRAPGTTCINNAYTGHRVDIVCTLYTTPHTAMSLIIDSWMQRVITSNILWSHLIKSIICTQLIELITLSESKQSHSTNLIKLMTLNKLHQSNFIS